MGEFFSKVNSYPHRNVAWSRGSQLCLLTFHPCSLPSHIYFPCLPRSHSCLAESPGHCLALKTGTSTFRFCVKPSRMRLICFCHDCSAPAFSCVTFAGSVVFLPRFKITWPPCSLWIAAPRYGLAPEILSSNLPLPKFFSLALITTSPLLFPPFLLPRSSCTCSITMRALFSHFTRRTGPHDGQDDFPAKQLFVLGTSSARSATFLCARH